jgi:putative endonuclease
MFINISSYKYGFVAEYIAMLYLFFCGYKILKHRYKTYCGEIDLICEKGKSIVAVEVKGRQKEMFIDELIDDTKIKRIDNAIDVFLSKNHKYFNYNIRIDAILVIGLFKIKHIKNIYS